MTSRNRTPMFACVTLMLAFGGLATPASAQTTPAATAQTTAPPAAADPQAPPSEMPPPGEVPPALAPADASQWRHAVALLGTPKYPPDFKHFDYVNPDAPKGGLVRLSDNGTFDSLNDIVPRGNPAAGI
ncbi:MAG: hypothetical protein ACAH27_06550, partial [Xanthobacteraceae bacterium]